ncbi:hypothetical protein B0T17DRAFT_620944 [Bombardia bombarda]|uniref:Zn(2)-C6 fungal-type domain-containing protein n=1 Tax=Bombardia bombarda TaxID=252184 RepID=A0AA39WAL3_9PEZI|nr:hypothetical protein B0T17DRAFT_620944 [Bombardia bombarda]
MVYCGKPSKGCQMCRTRRIKCDETRPTCNQCTKSRRQCPGYKDDFDLMLRNETTATERRAQKSATTTRKRQQQQIGQGTAATAARRHATPALQHMVKSSALQPALQIPVETRASCYFVSNFVLVPRQGTARGFMDYLIPLLRAQGTADTHIRHAFNACALALLGNSRPSADGGEEMGDKAVGEYTRALSATNTALRDPKTAKSDAVLATVLLLGMFESITAKKIGEFAWGSHIEGAIQLVKARGRKQLRTKTGLQLFVMVRRQLIIHTLTTGQAPIMGVAWWMTDAVNDPVATALQGLCLKTSDLRAQVTGLMTTTTTSSPSSFPSSFPSSSSSSTSPQRTDLVLALMRRAQSLDQDLSAWMHSLPPVWQLRTLCWHDGNSVPPDGDYSRMEVFPGRVDVYSDFWIASVWNMARTTRLTLASIIVRCAACACAPVDYRTTPEYATAARVSADVIEDIIASVPYHLGWRGGRGMGGDGHRGGHGEEEDMSGFACGEDGGIKSLAGYFLTWPLACVMGQDHLTDAQRAWVQGRLRYIGDELGIRYAYILCQMRKCIPSMLIRRDGLIAQPYPIAHNFEKLLSARQAPPAASYTMNPLQQRETMQKEHFERKRSELLAKASETTATESIKKAIEKFLGV